MLSWSPVPLFIPARSLNMRGLTLIETMVVLSITTVMMLALTSMIQYFYRTNAYLLEQTLAVNSARRSIEHAMQDLRESSYGADGSYPIASAEGSSIIFYADVDDHPGVEKVRYYVSGTTLYRGVTFPGGSPPSYTNQPEAIDLVVDNVRNDTIPIFYYFDAAGAALADPINVALVALIEASVMTDVNPSRAPLVYTLPGSATLRNVRPSE